MVSANPPLKVTAAAAASACRQPRDGRSQVRLVDDVVAVEDRPGLVPGELHRGFLRHARAHKVPDGRASEVMRDLPRAARQPAGLPPEVAVERRQTVARGIGKDPRGDDAPRPERLPDGAPVRSARPFSSGSTPYGNVRPSVFFVVPTSSRMICALVSTCAQVSGRTSLRTRQPV